MAISIRILPECMSNLWMSKRLSSLGNFGVLCPNVWWFLRIAQLRLTSVDHPVLVAFEIAKIAQNHLRLSLNRHHATYFGCFESKEQWNQMNALRWTNKMWQDCSMLFDKWKAKFDYIRKSHWNGWFNRRFRTT